MKISCIGFTDKGLETARKIQAALVQNNSNMVDLWSGKKGIRSGEGVKTVENNVHTWTIDHFYTEDAIVFVGAVGTAVRMIAPVVSSRLKDPAVIVVDEAGKWAVALLSGHIGGANHLTRQIAEGIGAQAVITTDADLEHRFDAGLFAKDNDMKIEDPELAGEISSAILDERPVGFWSDPLFPIQGAAPDELSIYPPETELYDEENGQERPDLGVCVSLSGQKTVFRNSLSLIPRAVVLGVNCKKGTEPAELERFLFNFLDVSGVSLDAVFRVAGIDVRVQEPAIRIFCRKYDLPFETYTAPQLIRVPGKFKPSSLVEMTVGVDNICERAAVLGAMNRELPGKLIAEKRSYGGMSAALALAGRDYCWEKPL